jgi:hypothetical protein
MSALETGTNIAVGYGLSLLTAWIVLPLFGFDITLGQNMAIGGIFTVVSIVRSYALRRVFEHIRVMR